MGRRHTWAEHFVADASALVPVPDAMSDEAAGGLAELLGEEGLLVTFGAASSQPLVLGSGPVIFKHLTVKGFWGAKVSSRMSAEDRTRLFGELIGLVLDGSLPLTPGGTFDLDDPTGAVTASQSSGRAGKILFRG